MAHASVQSSLVGEIEVNVEIKAPAKKFHHMLSGRPQDLSKVTPDNIQGCELREGEFGKVGSIIFQNYLIDGQPKVMKDRIEAVDMEKNQIALKVIEGDPMKDFKSLLIIIQATPKQKGPGSMVKSIHNG